MTLKVTFELSETDLAHYRRIMRQPRSVATGSARSRILETARRKLAGPGASGTRGFVNDRIERVADLCEMVTDTNWLLPDKLRCEALNALAYFAEDNDLIPDDMPGIGLVDDAIMLELVLTELADELLAYDTFRAALRERQETHADETARQRQVWIESERNRLRANLPSVAAAAPET